MAKNITLMGASYTDVPAVVLPQTGGGTASFTDVTDTTATASDVVEGKKFYAADGTEQIGTAVMGGDDFIITLTKNAETGNWEPDCTFAEAQAAYVAGKTVVVVASYYPCVSEYVDVQNHPFIYYEVDVEENDFVSTYTYTKYSYLWYSSGVVAQDPNVFYDTDNSDAAPADVASGKVFYNADGYQTGTASGGGGGSDEDFKAFIERSTTNPTLPSDLTAVGAYAFYNYANLALTSLPNGITSIGSYAFSGCNALALTSLPNGITSIKNYAFQNCSRLALTSLPDGLTSISSYAFSGCNALALTSLPDNVLEIYSGAFQYCKGITSLSGNCRITLFGSTAFNGNRTNQMQLSHVSFPNMAVASLLTVFGSLTATNACQQLEDADIGNTSAIGANAFANCNKLQTLILRKSDAICTLSNVSAFLNTPMRGYNSLSGTIYVPSALISTYQTATNWSTIYGEGHVTFAAIEGSEYEL